MSMCEDALRQAIADRPDGAPVSDLTVQLAVGGLVSLIRSRVAEGRSESLLADLPEITTALLTPVVGATATASVVEQIAAPAAGGASEQAI
jgi:hypothetical protein